MKTRTGFVSNSSSSSFIVTVKNPESPIIGYLRALIAVGAAYDKPPWVQETNEGFDLMVDYGDDTTIDLLDRAEKAGDIEVQGEEDY